MKRLLLSGIALVLALTACDEAQVAGGVQRRPDASPARVSIHTLATARRREAERKAERLLRRVVLPSGAIRVRHPPAGSSDVLLRSGLGVSLLTKFADRHAFWSTRLPVSAADSFVKAHPTAGLKWGSGGSEGGPGAPPNATEDFDGRMVGGRPVQRMESIAMVRLRGRTFIRIDAGAAWVYPRSPREVVPAGVREIDIADVISRRVTAPRQIALISSWFDALNVVPPGLGAISCPLIDAPRVTLDFRSASGSKLASAIVPSRPSWACDAISFSIRGHTQTPLVDSTPGQDKAFVDRVQRLLHVRFRLHQ
jgi:hypothetical protein